MVRRILRLTFVALAWGFVLAVPLQVYFAGLGVFRVSQGFVSGRSAPSYYATHITFGYLLGLIALGLLILTPIAGFRRRTIGWAGLLFLLNLIQTFILWMDVGQVQAFHPANGILIFAAALWMARSATQEYRRAAREGLEGDADIPPPPKSTQAREISL